MNLNGNFKMQIPIKVKLSSMSIRLRIEVYINAFTFAGIYQYCRFLFEHAKSNTRENSSLFSNPLNLRCANFPLLKNYSIFQNGTMNSQFTHEISCLTQ